MQKLFAKAAIFNAIYTMINDHHAAPLLHASEHLHNAIHQVTFCDTLMSIIYIAFLILMHVRELRFRRSRAAGGFPACDQKWLQP